MKLITLHKILIAFALAFFLFFGLRQIIRDSGNTLIGAVVLGIAVGVSFYFVWVLKGGYERK
jgi:Na+-driven multidrug efflux pump